jgi:hypothetical protein
MDRKRILRVASLLVIAGATGHLMEFGGAIAAKFGADAPIPADLSTGPMVQVSLPAAPREGDRRGLSIVPGTGDIRPAAAAPSRLAQPEPVRLAALATSDDAGGPGLPGPQAAPGCEARLSAEARPAALVQLTLDAPCHPQARVELRHGMLEVVGFTDAAGRLEALIPALAVTAEFTALLDGLAPVAAAVEVQALADYHRVAIAWAGVGSLELHAFEDGAGYGTDGHVWHGAPQDPARAESGSGGFSMRLGHADDPVPLMAEIYSVRSDRAGSVRLTVESPVDRNSCGLDLAGRAVEVIDGATSAPVHIVLALPHCDAAGSYLVLDNIFPGRQVAAR